MKSGGGTSSRSAVPLITSAFAIIGVTSSTAEKRPNAGEEAGQRKRIMKVASEQPMDASGSTTRSPNKKGKGGGVDRGGPRVGLHHPDLCEVIPSVDRGPLAGEYLRGALHPILVKQVYECSFEELMNRAEKSVVWELKQEAGVLCSSLDGARNDRARLEGDVLSLTEAAAFLEAELKVEGPKAMATYKVSRGFESGLERIGRVSYEFGYRVALERLWGKHIKIAIEQNPFAECPEDANVEMDLN
ncbi:hypothetical protein GW17_00013980 [Ensete ventricosum]|nr:hypothetical protein GW17_00013980 [Ensete ventricosum]